MLDEPCCIQGCVSVCPGSREFVYCGLWWGLGPGCICVHVCWPMGLCDMRDVCVFELVLSLDVLRLCL